MTVKLMEPTIPLKPAKSGASANEFFDLDAFKELEGKFYVEPKYDGIRVQAHRKGDKVKVFTDEGNEIQQKLPEITKELLSFHPTIFILDGELVKYKGRRLLSHEAIVSEIHQKDEVDEDGIRFKLFDILWLGDNSTVALPLEERKELIEKNFPDTEHIHKTEYQMVEQRKGETEIMDVIKEVQTSEGAVIKDIKSTYTKEHTKRWWKYKRQFEIDVQVVEVEKKDTTYIYTCAVKDDDGNLVEIGKTFATKIEAKKGDILRVSVDRVTIKDNKPSWLIPKVLEKRPPKDIDNFAVLRQLTHSEIWVQALAELEMSGDFVLQLHWWGEASHYDLRMGKNHGWFGFTIPGPGKEALESKDGADLKEGLELGKKFLALKKEYYGGKEWLEYGKEEIKEFPPGDKPTEGNPSTRLTAYMKAVDWGKYKLEKRIENELIIEFDGVKGVLSGRYFIIVAPESMQEKGAAEKWLISKAKEQEVKEISLQNSEQLSLKTLNGEQHIIDVTIIRPGPAKINLEGMKVIYTEEVLEKSLPLWNGTACFADHFNKSVRNIVGVFYDARYEEGVKAKLRFTDPSIFHLLQQILADREEGLPVPNIGISADINIKGIPIAGNIEVQEIINVISADIVFAPAAGGSFDRVLNSVRQQHGISDDPEKRIRDLQATADKLRAQVKNQEAQLQEALEQHKRDLLKDHPEIPEEMLTGTSIAELNASLEKASQLVERVKKNLEVQSIPIGAPVRSAPDVESLSPTEKIKYAIRKEA